MTHLVGYIQRRSGSMTPDQQRSELINYGVTTPTGRDQPIYESLEDALHPASVDRGATLIVWELGIIGLRDIVSAFVAVAAAGGKGIYSIKTKTFYPCHEEADQKHLKAKEEITKFNSKVRTESAASKGGRKPADAWEHKDEIISLSAHKHNNDLAVQFKCSPATIRRILQ